MDFNSMPEGCIANILSMLSPWDACRISLVSSIFRSAADSDEVWERFLPSDYRSIMLRSASGALRGFATKKELYFSLCNDPLIIDDGSKSFFLDKRSGKKCVLLGAKSLQIAWADNFAYWRWPSINESRFGEVAELRSVCWLEIRGKINIRMLSPSKIYAAYLVFRLNPEAYGLDNHPAVVSVGLIDGECSTNIVCLCTDEYDMEQRRRQDGRRLARGNMTGAQHPKQREDGWFEVELGVFLNMGGEDGELEICIKEVTHGIWKSGLVVEGIEVRPKEV